MGDQVKIAFSGIIRSVQPRSNVWRYRLDNRSHNVTGFNLFLTGTIDDESEPHTFVVAVSGTQQGKYHFHIGDKISGTAWTKKYAKWEFADYYRAGALRKIDAAKADDKPVRVPPWTDETPGIDVYNWRGCRMLARSRWAKKVFYVQMGSDGECRNRIRLGGTAEVSL